MNPMIYLIKKSKKTSDYIIHYFDKKNKRQAAIIRVSQAICFKKAKTTKAYALDQVSRRSDFKKLMFEHEEF